MRGARLAPAVMLVVAPLALVAGAAPAVADSVNDIGMTWFRDIVVDDTHGHVYVSQGNATVIVTDLAGVPVGTVDNMHGAAGMTLSPNGETLYVALSTGDAVAAVDTSSLAVSDIYPTGPASCPVDVAVTAGQVWFGGSCDSSRVVGAVDPTDGSVTMTSVGLASPVLRTSPKLPGQLFAVEGGISPTTIYAYTARGGDTPSLTLRTSRWDTGGNAQDLAITPDGTRIIQASGAPYAHRAYSTTDLSGAGSYASSNYPNSIAVRRDGMVAAGIDGTYQDDVYVYEAGSTTLHRSYEFGGSANALLPGGLAFGETNLYAVTGDRYSRSNFRLHVIEQPRVSSSADVNVTADQPRYHYGETAHLTVRLRSPSDDRAVRVYRAVGGTSTLLRTLSVPAGESRSLDLRVRERSRILVKYAGGGTDPASASVSLPVTARVGARMLNSDRKVGKYHVYDAGDRARMLSSVSPDHAGQCLSFRVQFLRDGFFRNDDVTGCHRLNADSDAWFGFPTTREARGHAIRIRGEWGGDERNLASVSAWRYVRFD